MSDGWKIVSACLGLVAVFVIGYVLVVALSGPVGKTEITRKTNGSDYGIANYDNFKDTCFAVVSLESKIKRATETLDSDTAAGVGLQQLSIDRQNLGALQNVRSEKIQEYNADAAKTATAAKWQASDLPRRIDENGVTTCE